MPRRLQVLAGADAECSPEEFDSGAVAEVAGEARVVLEFGRRNGAAEGALAESVDFALTDRGDLSGGFLGGVNAEAGEEIGDANDVGPGGLEAEEEVPIEGELERRVDTADAVPEAATPEKRFLGDEVVEAKNLRVVGRKEPAADFAGVFVDDDAMAVERVDFRMRGEKMGDVGECAGKVEIVGVDPRHHVVGGAGGFGESAADGVGLAGVGLGNEGVKAIGVAANEINAAVGRSAVLDDVVAGDRLIENAAERFFDEGGVLKGRSDDGKTWERAG